MKREYREVVFVDEQTGKKFLTRSTAETNQTTTAVPARRVFAPDADAYRTETMP